MLIINKKVKAFTLLELIVVIAIISILAVIAVPSFTKSLAKARDAKRVADIRIITDALYRYQIEYGGVPITLSYNEGNAGEWDYSSQEGFLTFFKDKGILNKVPVDPINNQTSGEPFSPNSVPVGGGYYYKYYCYYYLTPNIVALAYVKEVADDGTNNKVTQIDYTDFKCLTQLP